MLHKSWTEYTAAEINRIKKEKCRKCKYGWRSDRNASADSVGGDTLTCNYILMTGHKRPHRPEDCPGYKREKKQRRKSPRMVYGRELYEKVSNCSKSPRF